jgi:hypothetical protein
VSLFKKENGGDFFVSNWYEEVDTARLALIAAVLILVGDAFLVAAAVSALKKFDFMRLKD